MARSRMAREGRVGLLAVARARRCRGELAVRALAPALSSPGPLLLPGLASMRRTCRGGGGPVHAQGRAGGGLWRLMPGGGMGMREHAVSLAEGYARGQLGPELRLVDTRETSMRCILSESELTPAADSGAAHMADLPYACTLSSMQTTTRGLAVSNRPQTHLVRGSLGICLHKLEHEGKVGFVQHMLPLQCCTIHTLNRGFVHAMSILLTEVWLHWVQHSRHAAQLPPSAVQGPHSWHQLPLCHEIMQV